MYKAVISDLDGTLLNSQHQVSGFTRETLQALVERGVKFVVATGRHIIDVQGIRQTMGFSCDLITSNGALVSAADDSVLFEYTLAPELAEDLIRLTEGHASYDANVYTVDGWYLAREIPELLCFHKDSGFLYTVMDLSRLDMTTINKFCFTGDHGALLDLERQLIERHPGQASVVFSRDDCLEVMAANVNKGNSAQQALASHGLSIDEAVAFGDGMNDFEMLTMAARGYVMSNATERLRKSLPLHPLAATCDEDGVAQRLIEIFEL
jgi:Cof subfamily protein (haloacid dehalogenase superfamily)